MAEKAEPIDVGHRRIIKHDLDSTLFVEAGAGSGKTAALVGRIEQLVSRGRVPIEKIAAVTFTERAAAELRERLRARFEQVVLETPEHAGPAQAALDDLDLAAIGTLHSFAQRILTEHPIEAGIPPMIEVLDDVSSSVDAEARWRQISRELLDEDDMSTTVALFDPLGIRLETHIRSLVGKLNNDWDLVQDRVSDGSPAEFLTPDIGSLLNRARALASTGDECTDPNDKFIQRLIALAAWAERAEAGRGDLTQIVPQLRAADSLKWSNGQKAHWPGRSLEELRNACKTWQDDAAAMLRPITDRVLRNVMQWIGTKVLESAHNRRRNGRLEFHDLLVLSRNLLRENPEARAALQTRYPRVLLDEFQDTDPIQIEIAARIAGGLHGGAADWREIPVPPGALFVVGDPKQSIYRFRRADIGLYLDSQRAIGGDTRLSTNFRTVAPILNWVNEVFSRIIVGQPDVQPDYQPLHGARAGTPDGPAVGVLGAEMHIDKPGADELREREATDVARTIVAALDRADPWTTERDGRWEPLNPGDITILIPSRTSMAALENALDEAGVPFRAEASSLAYAGEEIRYLLAACRALADPSDQFALLTALRSPLFGCSDLDLWDWKRSGGQIGLSANPPETQAKHPVGEAIRYLSVLRNRSRWQPPSEILSQLAVDRMLFEAAADSPRARDSWRRLRFVIDQARAWSESEHGGLRAYTEWARAQSSESSRVSEAILPETDVDSVRIMTIHAAKGLEFPMVVLSGMTTAQNNRKGVSVLWTKDNNYEVSLHGDLTSTDFAAMSPVDEQMSDLERRRLLYVAATRARDHLVVSLHRKGKNTTGASLLADEGNAAVATGAEALTWSAGQFPAQHRASPSAPPEFTAWKARLQAAVNATNRPASESASGREGTDPDAMSTDTGRDTHPGEAKGARDVQQPAWVKGRYGSAIGRAVHGVLQSVSLDNPAGLAETVNAQCVAEGVASFGELVESLVRSALGSPVVQRAATRPHWRESYVAVVQDDGTVLEGIVDLIFRDDDGSLVVVDYKTDSIPDSALQARTAFYAPQVRAYGQILRTATGHSVNDSVLVFAREQDAAIESTVAAGPDPLSQ